MRQYRLIVDLAGPPEAAALARIHLVKMRDQFGHAADFVGLDLVSDPHLIELPEEDSHVP